MSGQAIVILGLAVALGGLIGILAVVAYVLDRRRRVSRDVASDRPEPGPIARSLLWIARASAVLMFASVIGFFVLRSPAAIWIAIGCFVAYLIVGSLYRVMLVSGR